MNSDAFNCKRNEYDLEESVLRKKRAELDVAKCEIEIQEAQLRQQWATLDLKRARLDIEMKNAGIF